MNTLPRITLISIALLLCICGAYPQQSTQGTTGGGVVAATAQSAYNHPQTTTIRMPAPPLHASVITGAPYSAEQVSDGTQTLADGTRITQRTRITKLYRDSQGRTRTERPWLMGINNAAEGVTIVEITDPVSGFRYVLDTYNRVAHRFSAPEKTNEAAPRPVQPPTAHQEVSSSITVRAPSPTQSRTDQLEFANESLGTQIIEGISAEGRKTTRTFPVGSVGNDRPIVSVTESWFSPELKVVVLSKTSDPRMGESTMKLQNIERSEPDPALFQAPSDYQLVDESSDRVEIKVTRP